MNKYYCIINVRDSVDHIADVLDSLMEQSLPPNKIVVVNDGSSDGTEKILAEYEKKYPDLIELMHTQSKTRDYKRIPKLWNMALREGYEYHMIGAGDVTYEKDYAKKLLEKMDKDHDLVITSGDYEPFTANMAHGGGRFVRQDFFYDTYDDGKYPYIIGYESEILIRARMAKKKTQIFNDIVFYHLDALGYGHNFVEFGYSMRSCGCHPLWAVMRCFVSMRQHHIGIKGGFNMLKYYITYKPSKEGYYSMFEPELRDYMYNYQKGLIKQYLKRILGKRTKL